MFYQNIFFSQNLENYNCTGVYIDNEINEKTLNCSSTSYDFIHKYNRQESYIPTEITPVKTILINFNIFQKNDGTGNFTIDDLAKF